MLKFGCKMNDENKLIKQFFQNFLVNEMGKGNIRVEYVLFLKILWCGFDDLISKNKIARKIYMLEHIEKYLVDNSFRIQIDSSELPEASELTESQNTNTPEIKLKEIDLVNFRGFRANDNGNGRKIEFHKKATLFFAPNGGGKTSLCEGIEWALTGDTYEHKIRKTDSNLSYFQNRSNTEPRYQNTKLAFIINQTLTPSILFDRCILEKNRIDKFAKLAMQPNKDLQEVLGELFGFSEVVDFFKEFGQDLSPTENEKVRLGRENWQIWLNWSSKKSELERILAEAKKEENKSIVDLKRLIGHKSFTEKKFEIEKKVIKLRAKLESIEFDKSKHFSAEFFQDRITSYISKLGLWQRIEKNISENVEELDCEYIFKAANNILQKNKN